MHLQLTTNRFFSIFMFVNLFLVSKHRFENTETNGSQVLKCFHSIYVIIVLHTIHVYTRNSNNVSTKTKINFVIVQHINPSFTTSTNINIIL